MPSRPAPGDAVIYDDVERDSPPFTPYQLTDLAKRGYRRRNRFQRHADPPFEPLLPYDWWAERAWAGFVRALLMTYRARVV